MLQYKTCKVRKTTKNETTQTLLTKQLYQPAEAAYLGHNVQDHQLSLVPAAPAAVPHDVPLCQWNKSQW
jgi:hypothetical protein